jgi:hypothetical protein
MPRLLKHWPVASSLFGVHVILVAIVYGLWATCPIEDDPQMVWLWAFLFDFPASLIYDHIRVPSEHLFPVIAVVFGGMQWGVVGAMIDLLRKHLVRRSTFHETRSI